MPVHSVHIFDRKGKTLFTKCYAKRKDGDLDENQLSEQRKLVFGMLFSLGQICESLSPADAPDKSLRKIQTGASTCHCFSTSSGLYFCLYLTPSSKKTATSGNSASTNAALANKSSMPKDTQARKALEHIYHQLWIQTVTRSPLYQPTDPNVEATNFIPQLDAYLQKQVWYR